MSLLPVFYNRYKFEESLNKGWTYNNANSFDSRNYDGRQYDHKRPDTDFKVVTLLSKSPCVEDAARTIGYALVAPASFALSLPLSVAHFIADHLSSCFGEIAGICRSGARFREARPNSDSHPNIFLPMNEGLFYAFRPCQSRLILKSVLVENKTLDEVLRNKGGSKDASAESLPHQVTMNQARRSHPLEMGGAVTLSAIEEGHEEPLSDDEDTETVTGKLTRSQLREKMEAIQRRLDRLSHEAISIHDGEHDGDKQVTSV